jgi:hypothetical protein
MAVPKAKYKIWKASKDSTAGFMVTPDTAVMAGSKNAFFAASKEGCSISGPVSFVTTSEQIRVAGLFVKMNDFMKILPSNIMMPIPEQMPFPPVSLFTSIALSLPFAIALLAG